MIYIDMDGVIADFEGWMKTHIPDINESMWKTSRPWKVMEDNYKDVYLDLKPLHLLEHMSHLYNSLDNVKFLTAIPHAWWDTPKGSYAKLNKTEWLQKHINNFNINDVIFTAGAMQKIQYVEPGAVLYDDREDTIEAWNKAGGTGILVRGQ